ncbi:MAG: hypothetical protein KGS47_00485 [Chloroflexi bacterium]|nr:hypothetical protein [Chloroflexota bacterium]
MDPGNPEDPSAELERLADEQLDANDADGADAGGGAARARRCARVLALYAAGAVDSRADAYHAACVLLYSIEAAHFDLAATLARSAARRGEDRAWPIIAAAVDRGRLARGQQQRFGTQFVRQGARWVVAPVDPAVSDALRAFYAVPPLWVLHQSAAQLQRDDERA